MLAETYTNIGDELMWGADDVWWQNCFSAVHRRCEACDDCGFSAKTRAVRYSWSPCRTRSFRSGVFSLVSLGCRSTAWPNKTFLWQSSKYHARTHAHTERGREKEVIQYLSSSLVFGWVFHAGLCRPPLCEENSTLHFSLHMCGLRCFYEMPYVLCCFIQQQYQ